MVAGPLTGAYGGRMGWSKLLRWAIVPSLGLAWLGCGGADGASGAEPVTPHGGGAGRAGAATTAGTNAAATAGANAAATAGQGSGGAAVAGGSESVAGGGAGSIAGAGGAAGNVFVVQLGSREACLPRALPVVSVTNEGSQAWQVHCTVTLATLPAAGTACVCDAGQKLTPPSAQLARAIALQAELVGDCGGAGGVACQNLCQCDLEQASGAALAQCQSDISTPIAELPPGFCYVDVELTPSLVTAAVVGSCPDNSPRMLRVLGPTPDPPPLMFLACDNAPL